MIQTHTDFRIVATVTHKGGRMPEFVNKCSQHGDQQHREATDRPELYYVPQSTRMEVYLPVNRRQNRQHAQHHREPTQPADRSHDARHRPPAKDALPHAKVSYLSLCLGPYGATITLLRIRQQQNACRNQPACNRLSHLRDLALLKALQSQDLIKGPASIATPQTTHDTIRNHIPKSSTVRALQFTDPAIIAASLVEPVKPHRRIQEWLLHPGAANRSHHRSPRSAGVFPGSKAPRPKPTPRSPLLRTPQPFDFHAQTPADPACTAGATPYMTRNPFAKLLIAC